MSFGKSVKGKKAPPPLPMYQPVVLKHVPTMVRRRYEHLDVDKLLSDPNHDHNQGGPINDRESEEDEDLEANDEDEFEDMGPGYISSEHGSASDDNNCDKSGYTHDYGLENSGNDQVLPENEYTDDVHDSNPSSEVDCGGVLVEDQNGGDDKFTDNNCNMGVYSASVSNGSIQPTDLPSEYSGSEDDGSEVSNHAPIADSNVDDDTEDQILLEFNNEQENSEIKDEMCSVTSHVKVDQDEPQDKRHDDFSIEQGLLLDDEEGGYVDQAESRNPASSANGSVNSETEVTGNEISSVDKQDTFAQTQNDDFGEDDLIQTRSFHLRDLKTEGDANNKSTVKTDIQGNTSHSTNNEEDFDPEVFTKTVVDGGYALCCPYCKHCITNTLIYHRRGNNHHNTTTCFTGLLGLFCCIRD